MFLTAGSLAGTPASSRASPARHVGPTPKPESPVSTVPPPTPGGAPARPYFDLSASAPFLMAASISLGVAAGAAPAQASRRTASGPAVRTRADIGGSPADDRDGRDACQSNTRPTPRRRATGGRRQTGESRT